VAPEIAFEALKGLKKTSTILDPMVGSGTVLRTVSEHGYNGIGFDIDPLAILMSRVWTTSFNSEKIKLLPSAFGRRSRLRPTKSSALTDLQYER
jgi:tRNA G10  N-methylase Trm11